MQELVKLGIMDQDEMNDLNERGFVDELNAPPKSFFGFDYNYNTDTDDEDKYYSTDNKNFMQCTPADKRNHMIALWRKLYN